MSRIPPIHPCLFLKHTHVLVSHLKPLSVPNKTNSHSTFTGMESMCLTIVSSLISLGKDKTVYNGQNSLFVIFVNYRQIPIKQHSPFCLSRKGNDIQLNSSLTAGCEQYVL